MKQALLLVGLLVLLAGCGETEGERLKREYEELKVKTDADIKAALEYLEAMEKIERLKNIQNSQ